MGVQKTKKGTFVFVRGTLERDFQNPNAKQRSGLEEPAEPTSEPKTQAPREPGSQES